MLGLTRIRPMEATSPTASPITAPIVLKRFQKIDKTMTGKFAEEATAKAKATRNATFAVGPKRMAIPIATNPTTKAATRATRTSSPGARSTSFAHDFWTNVVHKGVERAPGEEVRPEIVGKRGGSTNGKP